MVTYDYAHRLERERWRRVIRDGKGYCAELICLMPDRWIPPGTDWDLAHDRRTGSYLGPAHAKCNRSEGGRYRRANRRRGSVARRWKL